MCYPRRVARSLLVVLSLSAACATAAFSTEAHAEASAWASFSAGAVGFKQATNDFKFRSTLAIDGGVGTSPTKPFIFGGLFRIAPIIGAGTDLSLSLRGAMRSFQTGPFGIAVDAGAYLRTFGPTYVGTKPPWSSPTVGFVGGVILGGPLGSQLAILGSGGQHSSFGVSATLGIDLLRLTVYRQSLLDWWPNPSSPSVQHTASQVTRQGTSQASIDPARETR
jgi:hypothetical protein